MECPPGEIYVSRRGRCEPKQRCRSDETLVLAYNKCVEKAVCADNEILNPDTNRCVKRTGAVGRRILAAAAGQAIPARQQAPARQPHPKVAQEKMLSMTISFKKTGNKNKFKLELDTSKKTMRITKNDEILEEKDKPIDKLLKKFLTAYESLIKQGFTPNIIKMEHPEKLRALIHEVSSYKNKDFYKNCTNEVDPITLEPFGEMSDEQLKSIVVIGKNHCYLLESIYQFYLDAIRSYKIPKDPLDPSHRLTQTEIYNIKQKVKERDPNYVPLKNDITVYWKFSIKRERGTTSIRLLPKHENVAHYQPIHVVTIPSNTEIDRVVSSTALVEKLLKLFERNQLIRIDGTPTVIMMNIGIANNSNDFSLLCHYIDAIVPRFL
jgi:hypothetical protein